MKKSALPATMRKILQPDIQSTTLILTTGPLPVPTPGSDEHLIRVHAAALTNGELLWAKNFPLPEPNDKEPIPIDDIAGTVITAPPASPFKAGDEIYARTSFARTGSGRDYTIAVTSELALRPQKITWAEAATVPMSAETAWQALFVHAGLRPEAGTGARGKRVFVTAASGGVGSWVVQLACWAGAEVVATCSTGNTAWVGSLGASEVIDYRAADIKKWVAATADEAKKADVVIDCIGGKALEDAWWVVREGGTLISIVQPPELVKPFGIDAKKVRDLFFIVEPLGAHLIQVTKGLEEGTFVPALDSVFPMEKFEEAFIRLEKGRTKGKIVLDMGVKD